MKANWQLKKLGEICKITTGDSNTVDAITNGKYAFFDRSKIIKRSNRYLYDAEALIIPGEGKEFFPRYYSGKFDLHQRAYALMNFDKDVDIKFIEYYLIHEHKYFERVAVGATAKSLRRRHFDDLEIPLPSVQEQKRIVKILDQVFENIDKAKENTEKNLQNSKELFESYQRDIFAKPKKDWEEKNVEEILKLEYGKPLDRSDREDGGLYPVYGANGEKSRSNKFYAEKPSIIVGRKGSAGELNLTEKKFWPLDVTYYVTLDNKKYNLDFIYFLLSTLQLTKLARGVKPGINRNDVYSIKVNIPKSLSIQKAIVKKLHALSEQTKKLEENYKQKFLLLDELKKSVLSKSFAGKL